MSGNLTILGGRMLNRPVIHGGMAASIRNWHKFKRGTYQEFLEQHSEARNIGKVTKETYEYFKDAPIVLRKKYDRKSKKNQNLSRASASNSTDQKRSYTYRAPIRMYMVIYTVKRKEIGEQGIKALRTFLENLTRTNKAKMELVEFRNPDIIEVREFSR